MHYKISLLIPVYQTEKYLSKCLDSVFSQSLKEIEVICVNDGSKDNSLAILKEYQNKYSNLTIINLSQNEGLARARYHGILNAHGDYIMFLDSDDTLEPNACKIAYETITKYDVDIVNFGANVIPNGYVEKNALKLAKKHFSSKKFSLKNTEILGDCYVNKRYNWNVWTKIYKADLVKKVSKFIPNEKCVMSEDMMIYFFISYYANSFRSIPDNLINYNYGTGVSTSVMTLDKYASQLKQNVALKGIKDFLKANNVDNNEWINNIYLNLRNKTLLDLVGKFIYDVCDDDGGAAFDEFLKYYDVLDFIEALPKMGIYSASQLMSKISKSDFVKPRLKPNIKTIGIFYYRYSNGGVERVISKIIPILLKLGYKVVFFTEKVSKDLDYKLPKNVVVETLPPSDYVSQQDYTQHAREFILKLSRNQIDLMLYQASVALYLSLEILICKSMNIPICVTTHDWYSSTILAKDPYMLQKRINYSMCEAIQTITSSEEYTWKQMGVRAKYIPNPLTFNINNTKISKLNNHDILWVGRIDYRQKCPEEAVEAMRYVVKAVPDAKLHIIGTGERPSDTEYLKKVIKKYKLSRNVILHGYTKEVEKYYSACSMLLMTSSYEVYPMVLGEAMSYGLPIVMYDLPYVELLKNTNCFLSSLQLRPDLLANNIIRVLTEEKTRTEMGNASRRKIEEINKTNLSIQWKQFIEDIGNGNLACNENGLLSQVIDISNQHFFRSFNRNYYGSDHPYKYFNISDSRYLLVDTEYIDKDELYGLLLKGKSKLYKAYFFLFTNPKLFILKILRKICPKKKNKTNKKASKMAPNNSSLIENEK